MKNRIHPYWSENKEKVWTFLIRFLVVTRRSWYDSRLQVCRTFFWCAVGRVKRVSTRNEKWNTQMHPRNMKQEILQKMSHISIYWKSFSTLYGSQYVERSLKILYDIINVVAHSAATPRRSSGTHVQFIFLMLTINYVQGGSGRYMLLLTQCIL